MGEREDQILKQNTLRILRSPQTQRINFTFRATNGMTVSVNGSSFARVASAIESNRMLIYEGGVPAGEGQYNSEGVFGVSGHFRICPGRGQIWEALIVHEAAHAAFDDSRSVFPWIDNEAAGFIAQGFYLVNCGNRVTLDPSGAVALGKAFVETTQARIQAAAEMNLNSLRTALRTDSRYERHINRIFRGDG